MEEGLPVIEVAGHSAFGPSGIDTMYDEHVFVMCYASVMYIRLSFLDIKPSIREHSPC